MVGCSVRGCRSRSDTDPVKFYTIPALRDNVPLASKAKYEKRRSLWLFRLGKPGLIFEDTKMKICSLHFITGKPSSPLDVNNPDWVPSLRMEPESRRASSPRVNEDPVSDKDILSDVKPQLAHHSEQEVSGECPFLTQQSSTHTKDLSRAGGGQINSTLSENVLLVNWSFSDMPMDESFKSCSVVKQSIVDAHFESSCIVSQDIKKEPSLTVSNVQFQELELKYSQLLKSHAKLRDQLTEAEVDKLELSTSISELEEKCKGYEQENVSLKTGLSELSDKFKAQNDNIEDLQEQIVVKSSKMNTLEEQLKSVQSSVITRDRLKNDDGFVKFYTGLNNYEMFDVVLSRVTDHVTDISRSLQPWQGLLLTLMRLRLGLLLQDVAYRFDISVVTAGNIFEKWLLWLYTYLSPLINWSDRETLRLTTRNSLKEQLGDCAVIIGCFELFTERPGALDSGVLTWSNYKHHNTVKFLIGITPSGAVSFISEGWGGRHSDKHVTNNSGMYEKLLPGDVILADRGISIGNVDFHCGKTEIPAFTKGQAQLSSNDFESKRRLASLRVHVGKVIGLVKNRYRILKNVLPHEFLSKKSGHSVAQINEIVQVCCALTNFTESI